MKLFLILSFMFIACSCSDEKVKPSVNPSLNVEELPAQESWNATVYFSDSGKTTAILEAGHLRMFNESRETLLDDGVKVDFYNEEGIKASTLTSKRARVDDATSNLFAIDSVVVVNDSGTTITTDELMWRNSDKKIISDKFVTIISPKEKIQGYGFESDQHLLNYVIYNITYVTRRDSL
ncbi:MAG: LPS export ABC transporter periplasmic protein LptC [Ignavibacteriales bacterium]|nr:MAG: LPS export ABC transporter periplasmic protein LptC [Ignavibacteriales bacterium]